MVKDVLKHRFFLYLTVCSRYVIVPPFQNVFFSVSSNFTSCRPLINQVVIECSLLLSQKFHKGFSCLCYLAIVEFCEHNSSIFSLILTTFYMISSGFWACVLKLVTVRKFVLNSYNPLFTTVKVFKVHVFGANVKNSDKILSLFSTL